MDDRRHRGDARPDFDRFRLRTFVEALHAAGELEVRDDPIDLADVASALEANPKAVLFRKAGPEGWELTGNVAATMRVPVDELGLIASLRAAPLAVVSNVRIALRQRVPGEAKNAIAAAFGCLANVKHVFVVDPDIDIFSEDQMNWALATRFQADRDLVVGSGFRAIPLDPSLEGRATGAKAGFDLTLPVGRERTIETIIPEPPRFEGRRTAAVDAALADGPKRFEELMAAVGSRDGREVVRALEALRQTGRLVLDAEGRYALKADARGGS